MSAEPMDSTPQHTCITCRVLFRDLETQKQHYKCDWHRYNLKRKVADLPPLSVEEFKKRVTEHQKDEKPSQDSLQCKSCKKHFSSQNQYDNHLNSKKHKERIAKIPQHGEDEELTSQGSGKSSSSSNGFLKVNKIDEGMETDSEVESVDSEEWEKYKDNPTTRNNCIFCPHHSRSWVRNLKHMTEAHSFFIPDLEYCTDVKGLIEYLGEKVCFGYMCIWCSQKFNEDKPFTNVQDHMIDKGHCKMRHEGENLIEYEDFYDYSSSYPDAQNADPDEIFEIPVLENDDYQLVLPSGAVIGHRSLMRYYKQSLRPNSAVSLPKSQKLRKVMSMYKSLGWKGNDKATIVKKIRDIQYMHRVQAKYSTKLQFKQNKFQPHFRQQVNF